MEEEALNSAMRGLNCVVHYSRDRVLGFYLFWTIFIHTLMSYLYFAVSVAAVLLLRLEKGGDALFNEWEHEYEHT